MEQRIKIIRTTTVPASLVTFCSGLLSELRQTYDVVVLSSPGVSLVHLAEQEGVAWRAVRMERRISVLRDVVSLVSLYRVFRAERPQMVHSMTPKAGLLCMMAAWMARVPVRVHTFTGLVFPSASGLKRWLLMATDWLTCRCATHIIPEGEGVRQDLLHYGITHKPLRVLGYGNVRGIDLTYFDRTPEVMEQAAQIRKHLHIGEREFVFLFVGRIVRDKGIKELIKAYSLLEASYKHPVHLVLVGREERDVDPIDAVTGMLLAAYPRIHAVGEQVDVRPWYAAANALVLPSYREGVPNVVIEAGAMGLPSVVSDVNGSREIVLNGRNGVVVPVKNADALYRAMWRMVTSPERTKRMAEQARPMVASRYEQGFVRQCLKTFYAEVLKA